MLRVGGIVGVGVGDVSGVGSVGGGWGGDDDGGVCVVTGSGAGDAGVVGAIFVLVFRVVFIVIALVVDGRCFTEGVSCGCVINVYPPLCMLPPPRRARLPPLLWEGFLLSTAGWNGNELTSPLPDRSPRR